MTTKKSAPKRHSQRQKPREKAALTPVPRPPRDSFQVVIQCASEDEQEQLYNEFRSRGVTVRLLTM